MASLVEKLTEALQTALKEAELHLEELPGDRVGGMIVSPDFSDLDHQARQKKLKEIVESLPAELALRVGPITALTPAEWSVEIPSDS